MPRFQDKVVLVTGGTAGIGRATSEAFAKEGARVVVTGRTPSTGKEFVARLRAQGMQALFVAGDTSREEDVKSWVEATIKEFGRLDVAVNNAGTEGTLGPITEQTVLNYEHVFDANVKGLLLALKHEIPALVKPGGSIVNLSSIVGDVAMAGASLYVASKHAVNGLTRTAALETASLGIRVNAVAPGAVLTSMSERFTGGNKEYLAALAKAHPIGRLAQPEEIATTILFLASEEARFITGSVLLADGGYTAQ
jgi:NAD(P)-dependent dehydrogenase (short-subunit alcohol dehydrogenase family)